MSKITKLSEKDIKRIVELYESGETFTNIAKTFGISRQSVTRRIKDAGVYKLELTKTCELCKEVFHPSVHGTQIQKYCSDACRMKAHAIKRKIDEGVKKEECTYCGDNFIKGKRKKFCSKECATESYKRSNSKRECVYCKKYFRPSNHRKCCSNECKRKKENLDRKKRWRLRKCKYCGLWKHTVRRKYCSKECGRRGVNLSKELRKNERLKIARRNGQFDADIDIYKLIERDGGHCYLCGDDILFTCHFNDPKYPTIEHVMPIAKGGTHSWDNVKVACRECNTRKSTTLIDDFMKGGE